MSNRNWHCIHANMIITKPLIIVALVACLHMGLCCNAALALTSDKEIRTDDNDGDSPGFVSIDGSDQELRVQKLDGNGAVISSSQGPIAIKPSGVTNRSLSVDTSGSNVTVSFSNALTNKPGMRLNDASGRLELRDQNATTWNSINWSISAKTSDFTITAADDKKFFVVNNTSTVTATLPSAATVGPNYQVSIARMGANGDVVINRSGTDTINGGYDGLRLGERNAKATLISNGTNWYEFEHQGTVYGLDVPGTCPTGYITVPANSLYGITSDFCIAKYEMKNVSGAATSQAAGTPWVSITQTAALTACTALGTGYHLVTNNEWMTAARNIENMPTNWQGSAVGTGALNRGHSDSSPNNALAANADDTQACDGTGQTCSNLIWSDQRRTHYLSTGEAVWDLAGNVWEWTNWNVVTDKASPQAAWIEINAATPTTSMPQISFYPEHSSYNATIQGIGRYFPSTNGYGGTAVRGGAWNDGTLVGVFALTLDSAPSDSRTRLGFRCAWSAGG